MKKILLVLAFAFAFALVAPLAHADIAGADVVINQDAQFKRGYFPEEVGRTTEWVNPLYQGITNDNPSVQGLRIIIDNLVYDFTK